MTIWQIRFFNECTESINLQASEHLASMPYTSSHSQLHLREVEAGKTQGTNVHSTLSFISSQPAPCIAHECTDLQVTCAHPATGLLIVPSFTAHSHSGNAPLFYTPQSAGTDAVHPAISTLSAAGLRALLVQALYNSWPSSKYWTMYNMPRYSL
jgi:hypothetical protein